MLPREKLKSLVRRHEEVERLLCDPNVLSDMKRLNSLNRERTQLVPIVEATGVTTGRVAATNSRRVNATQSRRSVLANLPWTRADLSLYGVA